MTQWTSSVTANAASTTSVAGSQTPTSAITLAATPVTFGSSAAQKITIISAANISNRTIVIVGTDVYDRSLTETITGPNTTTVTTVNYFKSVITATISGLAAGALTMGNSADAAGAMYVCDADANPFSIGMGCSLLNSTTPTYTIQHTFDNVLASNYSYGSTSNVWFPHSVIVTKTANQDGNYDFPVKAIRLVLTVAGSVQVKLIQSGV